MKVFENAEKFFRACEAREGWAGCREYVANGTSYDLHVSCFDEATRASAFSATYTAKHTGEPGPVPPAQKETHSHYAYFLTMDDDDKVARMIKIWNAPRGDEGARMALTVLHRNALR